MADREVLLRVENLCQYFGGLKAVDNVSFDIKKGEVFGLVGESGCGKTTTGRSIMKIYDITSGSIYFKGQRVCAGTQSYREEIAAKRKEMRAHPEVTESCKRRIARLKEEIRQAHRDQRECDRIYAAKMVQKCRETYTTLLKKARGNPRERERLKRQYDKELASAKKARLMTQMQMIFQDPIASLNPRMTVKEINAEGLVISGITDKAYIDRKVYEVLEMVGLVREHAGRYPHEFSGGQRQRIGIARSIIMEPELLIADEPISALDVSIQAQIINLLNELRKTLHLTVLFIAHDLSVVKYFSDRIGVMYSGKIVELAPSDELFAHPLHPYTRSLLSAIPLPDPRKEKQRVRMVYEPAPEEKGEDFAMREITPGHFVYCTQGQADGYREALGR